MNRYLIVLEYIGTNYQGSQKQPEKMFNRNQPVRTVQEEIEKAISTLTKTKTKTIFSGRTDAGVHSKGQCVHFDTELNINSGKFVNSLNGILPKDISVRELKKVPETFHAQKSAKARHYRYVIANRNQRSAWDRNCLLVRFPINIERLNKALKYLEGEHDFTSFKKVKTSNPARICNMYECKATKEGDYIHIDFIADRFLYNMIRAIVGTLLMLEKKNLSAEMMKEILESRDKTKAGSTISPEGLTLVKVIYNDINGEKKMKTYSAKPLEVERKWYLLDAEGQTLGRLAVLAANLLRGKHKPQFTPNVDTGDFVIIINSAKIQVTGKKFTDKMYYHHTGYPGGLKSASFRELMEKNPTLALEKAIKGMLPHSTLGREQFNKLKIYAGADHPHAAQKPVAYTETEAK